MTIPCSWVEVETPLPSGAMLVAVTSRGVIATTYWGAVMEGLPAVAPPHPDDLPKVERVTSRLREYFAGRRQDLGLPIDWRLTNGAQRVILQTLQGTVPFGQTVTYGELAKRSGVFEAGEEGHLAARMVGTVMGSNPLPLLVPCHRVVAADGLGGFGGALGAIEVKQWLLTLEGVLAPTLDWDGPG